MKTKVQFECPVCGETPKMSLQQGFDFLNKVSQSNVENVYMFCNNCIAKRPNAVKEAQRKIDKELGLGEQGELFDDLPPILDTR